MSVIFFKRFTNSEPLYVFIDFLVFWYYDYNEEGKMRKDLIKTQLIVKEQKVGVVLFDKGEYISLTDLASYVNQDDPSGVIRNWMSSRNSFEFYSLWEEINNPDFNSVESHRIKIDDVPYSRFTMTPKKWKDKFNAIGIIPSSGKYSSGTFAHSDIAFEFASWLSPEFKLYLITEFQRLKKNESFQNNIDWHANRLLSKINYEVHTDSIRNNIVPNLTDEQKKYVYAEEADVLNVALFGMTAKEWRSNNANLDGNIRDYADLLHLVVLNNLENINAELMNMKIPKCDRLVRLNDIAKKQMELIRDNKSFENLEYFECNVNNKLKIV